MPSTFSPVIRAELIADNEQAGAWGQTTNRNFTQVFEEAITATSEINVTANDVALTAINGGSDQSRRPYIRILGDPAVPRVVTAANVNKNYFISNTTGQEITFKGLDQTGVVIPAGETAFVRLRQDDTAQQVRIAALGGPATFTQVKLEGNTATPDPLLLVNQLGSGPTVAFWTNGVPVMTIQGTNTTFRGTVSFPDVVGGGFLPLGGGTLSGHVQETRAGSAQYMLYVPDAPGNHRQAIWRATNQGVMQLGHYNDANTSWLGGLELRSDYKLYDLLTNRLMTVDPPGGGGYVPVVGSSTIYGSLYLDTPGWTVLNMRASAGIADHRLGRVAMGTDGAFYMQQINDAYTAIMGGLYIDSLGVVRDQSGGKFWHAGNMGTSSGLDADTVRGRWPDFNNTDNTLVWRIGGGGEIRVGPVATPYIRGGVSNGADAANAGVLNMYGNTGNLCFRWDGTLLYRINEVLERRIMTTSDFEWSQTDPGYLQVGPIIIQWGSAAPGIDNHYDVNLRKPWSFCVAAVACPMIGIDMVGSSVVAGNVQWVSTTQIRIGVSDQAWSGAVPMRWIAIGW